MTEQEKNDKSLDFVVRYYRKGAFRPRRLGKILEFVPRYSFFCRRNIAAACVATALIASAGIGVYFYTHPNDSTGTSQIPAVETTVTASKEVHRIEFNNVPLTTVVKEIEKTYNVKISSLPKEQYRLTLSYEGTAEDLVATINELLGTNLEIEQ